MTTFQGSVEYLQKLAQFHGKFRDAHALFFHGQNIFGETLGPLAKLDTAALGGHDPKF